MGVPFVDLKAQYRQLAEPMQASLLAVIEATAFVQGPAVRAFEAAFAAYCDVPEAVGVGSGTAALHIAIQALGAAPGDEVIVPSHTFVATAEAVSNNGATPRFVDCDPATYQLDPQAVAAAIGPRTKGIVAVHLYGHPAPMTELSALAKAHGLWLIEDAAQAHGARLHGQRVGGLSDLACFSFYPGKNLGAYGDGGAVTGRDRKLLARVRRLANHGRESKYEHLEVGWCERLDTLQAAVLNVKLPHLDSWNAGRRQVATWYERELAGTPLVLPTVAPGVEPVFHLYVVRVQDRDALQASLKGAGIETGVHYPIPLHLQPCYASLGHHRGDFPVCEQAAAEILSLPMFAEMTEAQVVEVAAAVKAHYGLVGATV